MESHLLYMTIVVLSLQTSGDRGWVLGHPNTPWFEWESMKPVEGTCEHFRGNISRAGYVSTPRYPHNYPDSLACDVIVYVPMNHMARIYFIDFALEASRDCWLDHLEITQQDIYGYNEPLGRFCGRKMPPLIVGYEPSVTLSFMSDRYINARGFRARLQYISLV